MKELYFMRHGECEANFADQTVGQLDSPLTDKGREQAKKAGSSSLKSGLEFDLIISSPLSRAKDTAEIFAKEIGYPDNLIMIDELLLERSLGPLEGPGKDRSYFKIDKKFPEIDRIEGAETVEDLQKRAAKFYKKVRKLPEQTILIVGHGMFGRSLRRTINGQPYSDEYLVSHSDSTMPNGVVTKFK